MTGRNCGSVGNQIVIRSIQPKEHEIPMKPHTMHKVGYVLQKMKKAKLAVRTVSPKIT